jgi:branched-subunit amino acid transport protein AzlD
MSDSSRSMDRRTFGEILTTGAVLLLAVWRENTCYSLSHITDFIIGEYLAHKEKS